MSRGFLSEPDYVLGPADRFEEENLNNFSDEQCCSNCRFYRRDQYTRYCMLNDSDDGDPDMMYPDGVDCCDSWEGW